MENEKQNESEMNTQESEQNARYAELLDQNARMKKRFLKILAIVGVSLAALLLIVVGINILIAENAKKSNEEIFFYPPYEGNIFENERYMELDRKVYYFDGSMTKSIEEDQLHHFPISVLFLCDFINTMIYGDAAAYNACFTTNPGQADFSQQMIYDILISYESSTGDTSGNSLIKYKLEYRIYRNDGTLRNDVAADRIKPQYVTLRLTSRGDISIDSLSLTK